MWRMAKGHRWSYSSTPSRDRKGAESRNKTPARGRRSLSVALRSLTVVRQVAAQNKNRGQR